MNFINNSCSGNGICINNCECYCKNICTCGHYEHNGYCLSKECSCVLQECRNIKFCKTKMPQWILDCHNGLCDKCLVQMGNHIKTNIVQECPICFEDKRMIKLQCNHFLCNECWYSITKEVLSKENIEEYVECPICRSKN